MDPAADLQALVGRAKEGSREAMDELLTVLRPHLENLARRYADAAHASESTSDLVQEAWLRAWQKIDQFQGGRDDAETLAMFRAWAGQIVHRLGINAKRDRQAAKRAPAGRAVLPLSARRGGTTGRRRRTSPAAADPSPSACMARSEETRRVQDALAKLDDKLDRDIVRLRVFEGLTLRETASRLGITVDQVRGRFQSALRQLERELGEPE